MSTSTPFTALQVMQDAPVIPVIVLQDVAHAVPMARALVAGGVRMLEITLRTPQALACMERIAAEADVAKATLYKHFPVKEALLRHRFHRELRDSVSQMGAVMAAEPVGAARLAKFFALSAAWSEAHRAYLLPYVQYRLAERRCPDDEAHRSGLERIFTALIAEGQAAGQFRTDMGAPALAVCLEFLYLAALLRWLTGQAPALQAEFDTMLMLFLGGLEVRA